MVTIKDLYWAKHWIDKKDPKYVFSEEFAKYVMYVHSLILDIENLAIDVRRMEKDFELYSDIDDEEYRKIFTGAKYHISTRKLNEMRDELSDAYREQDAILAEKESFLKSITKKYGKEYAKNVEFFSNLYIDEIEKLNKGIKIKYNNTLNSHKNSPKHIYPKTKFVCPEKMF